MRADGRMTPSGACAMPVFETERLTVRQWTTEPADLARILDTYSRPEVARWLGATPKPMADLAEALAAVRRWQALSEDSAGRYGAWAIVPRSPAGEPRPPAGTVLFKELPDGDGEIEVGWHLHPDSWGHGYATEAARGAIARGFAAGPPEVYAVVYPENRASLAVCRRLGMTPLGRTTRWYGVEVESFVLRASG